MGVGAGQEGLGVGFLGVPRFGVVTSPRVLRRRLGFGLGPQTLGMCKGGNVWHAWPKDSLFCAKSPRLISDVKSNSAPGIDGISPKFIKMAKVALAPILTKLYNKCLQQECFPDDFKVGQVIPISKTLAPKELGEFRPIPKV